VNPNARIKLLHAARRKLGLSEEDYRAILSIFGGHDSAKTLVQDANAFERVLARFWKLGFISDKRQAAFGPNDRIGMAMAGQIALIRELWAEVTNGGSDTALNKWLSRFGPSALIRPRRKSSPL